MIATALAGLLLVLVTACSEGVKNFNGSSYSSKSLNKSDEGASTKKSGFVEPNPTSFGSMGPTLEETLVPSSGNSEIKQETTEVPQEIIKKKPVSEEDQKIAGEKNHYSNSVFLRVHP